MVRILRSAPLLVLLAQSALAEPPPTPRPGSTPPSTLGTAPVPAGTAPPPAAAPTGTVPAPSIPTVVLLDLDANPAARDVAPAVGTLLADVLSESTSIRVVTQRELALKVGPERERQLFGDPAQGHLCGGPCLSGLAREADARYVVTGRLDRFGNTFVVTASLLDPRTEAVAVKSHADAASDADLPAAIRQLAGELLKPVAGAPGKPAASAAVSEGPPGRKVVIALKGGSNFLSSLETLSPAADVEVGYRFHREWVGFVQVGVAFVTAKGQGDNPDLGVNVVPSVVGARHFYNVDSALQPFWGLGLGVQLSFGDLGPIGRTGLLPTVVGFGGLQYLFSDWGGVMVELKTDLAQTTLGIFTAQGGVGLHLDLSLGVVFRL